MFPRVKVLQIEAKGRLGISDMIAMVPGLGCIAIENKYVKEVPAMEGTPLLKHKLSGQQRRFLIDWSSANNGLSFIAIGVGDIDSGTLILIPSCSLEEANINEMSYGDMYNMVGVATASGVIWRRGRDFCEGSKKESKEMMEGLFKFLGRIEKPKAEYIFNEGEDDEPK